MPIETPTLFGKLKKIEPDEFVFRPSVYGIIVENSKILLVKMKHTGKYYLPGGAVEKGETIAEALKREVYEETGIIVENESFLAFKEKFFYFDPLNEAYHVLAFFYKVSSKSNAINGEHLLEDEEATNPCWIDLSSIASIDLQDDRELIIESVNQLMLPLCPSHNSIS